MALTTTNIADLEKHLKSVFEELLKTKSFERKAVMIGDTLQNSVINMLDSGRYDYNQSGNLRHLIKTSDSGWKVTKTKVSVGFGSLEDLSDPRFAKRQPQRAVFNSGTDYKKTIVFGSEPDLPEWIIAEFGRKRGTGGSNTSGIPKEFLVSYSSRDSSKEFMMGPSDSRHFRKNIYFMASRNKIQSMFPSEPISDLRRHPGVVAGHIFSSGLSMSIPKVREQFEEAIRDSLIELSNKYGNRGGVEG
jgi:hypothetical protein